MADRYHIQNVKANNRIIVMVFIDYSMRVYAVRWLLARRAAHSQQQGESGPSLAPEV
jgi:hypothetical protein